MSEINAPNDENILGTLWNDLIMKLVNDIRPWHFYYPFRWTLARRIENSRLPELLFRRLFNFKHRLDSLSRAIHTFRFLNHEFSVLYFSKASICRMKILNTIFTKRHECCWFFARETMSLSKARGSKFVTHFFFYEANATRLLVSRGKKVEHRSTFSFHHPHSGE